MSREEDAMTTTLEERVESLEKEVSRIKAMIQGKSLKKDWRATFGMSRNDPGFEEMVRLGREIRQSQREEDS